MRRYAFLPTDCDVIYADGGQATHRVSLPECLDAAPLEALKPYVPTPMQLGRSQVPFGSGTSFILLVLIGI